MNSINIQVGKIYESRVHADLTETDGTSFSKIVGFLRKKETFLILETITERHWLHIKIVTMNGIIGWFVRLKQNMDLFLKRWI